MKSAKRKLMTIEACSSRSEAKKRVAYWNDIDSGYFKARMYTRAVSADGEAVVVYVVVVRKTRIA